MFYICPHQTVGQRIFYICLQSTVCKTVCLQPSTANGLPKHMFDICPRPTVGYFTSVHIQRLDDLHLSTSNVRMFYTCPHTMVKSLHFATANGRMFYISPHTTVAPPGFNRCFSFASVFQWCCSTPQGSPGVDRNTFPSSPHLCFIIALICDLFVSRDDPLMS